MRTILLAALSWISTARAFAGEVISPPGALYSFELPDKWADATTYEDTAILLTLGKTKGNSPGLTVSCRPELPPSKFNFGDTALSSYLDDAQKPPRRGDKSFSSTKPVDTIAAGRKALRFRTTKMENTEVEDRYKGKPPPPFHGLVKTEYVVIPMKDGYCAVEASAAEIDFPIALRGLEALLKTLKLKERPPKSPDKP